MKTLFTALIFCTALLPMAHSQTVEPARSTYGGFEPGKTFAFNVVKKVTTRTSGTDVTNGVPVPKGIPAYKKGERVKFTIGEKGQLITSEMSMKFDAKSPAANMYVKLADANSGKRHVAIVYKTSGGKPKAVAINFYSINLSGFNPTITTVTYKLE